MAELTPRESIMAAQRYLGVRVDGIWGPKTDAAFAQAGSVTQDLVRQNLARGDISPDAIRVYQRNGGDSNKALFENQVIPKLRTEARRLGLNADVMIGQLRLESGGGGRIPTGSYNWGGIKAVKGQDSITANTEEWDASTGTIKVKQGFRKFDSPDDFVAGYVKLVTNNRYKAAYSIPDNAAAATAIRKAGYATDPAYATKLARMADKETVA